MPVRERFLPRPGARLQEQFREVARFRHLSLRTEEAYWDWIRRFILFHRRKGAVGSGAGVVALAGEREGWIWRHPREMGGPEVREFLTHLAVERRVAVATQNQALNALVFLYREVFGRELGELWEFERARRRERVPVVLTRQEVERVLRCTAPKYRLVLQLLYGTGMRLLEGLRLRV